MKIRMGFITNSSSTNFLIISKEELTEEYLFEKLGFIKDGMLEKQGRELCRSIIYALDGGLRYHNYEIPDYESIKKVFGEKSARLFVKSAFGVLEPLSYCAIRISAVFSGKPT